MVAAVRRVLPGASFRCPQPALKHDLLFLLSPCLRPALFHDHPEQRLAFSKGQTKHRCIQRNQIQLRLICLPLHQDQSNRVQQALHSRTASLLQFSWCLLMNSCTEGAEYNKSRFSADFFHSTICILHCDSTSTWTFQRVHSPIHT